jgi:cytochrome c biogenesis protein CcmG/thiol:disulfide interchange protein DsbE
VSPQPKRPMQKGAAPKRSGSGAYVALIVAALVVVVAVIAVVVTRSGSDSNASAAGPQTYPVTVTGDALPTMPDSGTDAAIGKVAPTLTGQSLFDGTPLTINPGDGKATLVVFVAHWCPHCQREVPLLVQWMSSGQKPADLDVVAVSTANNLSDQNSPASAWLQRENWPTPVLADSSDDVAAQAYGLPGYPYLVVLGTDGTVKARTSGELSLADLNTFITNAL